MDRNINITIYVPMKEVDPKTEALRTAVNYLWLGDNSEFYNSLWDIVEILATPEQYELSREDLQELLIQLDKETGNYDPDIWEG